MGAGGSKDTRSGSGLHDQAIPITVQVVEGTALIQWRFLADACVAEPLKSVLRC